MKDEKEKTVAPKFGKRKTQFPELITATILTVITAIIISIRWKYCWSSNDDAIIRAVLSGIYTKTPDGHVFYVMYPLSAIFAALYKVFPNVPWYDGFSVGIHYLCWWLISFRLGNLFERKHRKVLATVAGFFVTVAVDLKYVVLNQYTVLSAVMASVAVLYIITGKYIERKTSDLVVVLSMLTLSMWLRKEAFLMSVPVIFVAVIYECAVGEKKAFAKRLRQCILPAGIMAAIAVLSVGIHMNAYSSTAWQNYKEFNASRSGLVDFNGFPDYASHKDVYDKYGISVNDLNIMKNYCEIGLVNEVTKETLTELNDISQKEHYSNIRNSAKFYIKDGFKAVGSVNTRPVSVMLITISAWLIWRGIVSKRKMAAVLGICMPIYCYMFAALFNALSRYIERVAYGADLIMLTAVLGAVASEMATDIVATNHPESPKNAIPFRAVHKVTAWFEIAVLAILTGWLIIFNSLTTDEEYSENFNRIRDWESISEYASQHSDDLLFVNTYTVAPLPQRMFEKTPSERENIIRTTSWLLTSPVDTERRSAKQITFPSYTLLYENNAYMIVRSNYGTEWLENLIGEHKEFADVAPDCEVTVVDTIKVHDGELYVLSIGK